MCETGVSFNRVINKQIQEYFPTYLSPNDDKKTNTTKFNYYLHIFSLLNISKKLVILRFPYYNQSLLDYEQSYGLEILA